MTYKVLYNWALVYFSNSTSNPEIGNTDQVWTTDPYICFQLIWYFYFNEKILHNNLRSSFFKKLKDLTIMGLHFLIEIMSWTRKVRVVLHILSPFKCSVALIRHSSPSSPPGLIRVSWLLKLLNTLLQLPLTLSTWHFLQEILWISIFVYLVIFI